MQIVKRVTVHSLDFIVWQLTLSVECFFKCSLKWPVPGCNHVCSHIVQLQLWTPRTRTKVLNLLMWYLPSIIKIINKTRIKKKDCINGNDGWLRFIKTEHGIQRLLQENNFLNIIKWQGLDYCLVGYYNSMRRWLWQVNKRQIGFSNTVLYRR